MMNFANYFAAQLFLAGIEISSGTVILTLLATFSAMAFGVLAYKKHLANKKQNLINKYEQADKNQSAALRKYEEVAVFKFSGLGLKIGGVVALLLAFLSINYTTYLNHITYDAIVYEMPIFESNTMLNPPSTPTAPPPPAAAPVLPPPPPPANHFVATDAKVEKPLIATQPDPTAIYDPNATGDTDYTNSLGITSDIQSGNQPTFFVPTPPLPLVEEKQNEIFEVVEQMPRFPGCEAMAGDDNDKKTCADQKMLQWIYSQIKYPALAREMGVEGTAIISFVVNEKGEIINAEVRKKVGGGCEEEALRVIKEMSKMTDKWTPGKQRGKAVAVRYTLPVRFKLKS